MNIVHGIDLDQFSRYALRDALRDAQQANAWSSNCLAVDLGEIIVARASSLGDADYDDAMVTEDIGDAVIGILDDAD